MKRVEDELQEQILSDKIQPNNKYILRTYVRNPDVSSWKLTMLLIWTLKDKIVIKLNCLSYRKSKYGNNCLLKRFFHLNETHNLLWPPADFLLDSGLTAMATAMRSLLLYHLSQNPWSTIVIQIHLTVSHPLLKKLYSTILILFVSPITTTFCK